MRRPLLVGSFYLFMAVRLPVFYRNFSPKGKIFLPRTNDKTKQLSRQGYPDPLGREPAKGEGHVPQAQIVKPRGATCQLASMVGPKSLRRRVSDRSARSASGLRSGRWTC